ncbi:MAG: nitrogen fixation protein NifX, partial [Alphaproteobacteria bacterium]|nr:nitrogen fixation protein NifX [Alphaproteobacteria bacterium]
MHVRRLGLIEEEGATMTTDAPTAAAAIRVAIATNDHRFLDAHFGSATSFAVFEVSPDRWRFVEMVTFDDVTAGEGDHPDSVDRITPKVEALKGNALLFVLAIGGPSAAKVVRAGIHPVKLKEPEPLGQVVLRVQRMLQGKPPPWLRK